MRRGCSTTFSWVFNSATINFVINLVAASNFSCESNCVLCDCGVNHSLLTFGD